MLSLVIIVLAGVAAAMLVGRPLMRWVNAIRRPRARVAAALLLVSPTLAIVFVVGCFVGSLPMESGDWQCLACGRLVGEVRYFSVPVSSCARDGGPEREFEAWFLKVVSGQHSHDWAPMGCHRSATAITCYRRPYQNYFRALPRVPDAQIAASMARKVAGASQDRRRQILACIGRFGPVCTHRVGAADLPPGLSQEEEFMLIRQAYDGELWRTLAEGGTMTAERFRPLYTQWQKFHPDWR